MSILQKCLLKNKLPPSGQSRTGRRATGRKHGYKPSKWCQYFEESIDISIDEDVFRVYLSGKKGPVIVLLHGGGFSALTWALFSSCISSMVECRVMAIDLRGHGDSKTNNDEDLSAETMARDVGAIIREVFSSSTPPPIVLLGHSMGGAIAVHIASIPDLVPSLIGLGVIDVVEGTAMDALSSMQNFLRSRPSHFNSIIQAIEWCVRSGQVRNVESAQVSMPGQIKNVNTGLTATNHLDDESELEVEKIIEKASTSAGPLLGVDSIEEESEEESEDDKKFKKPALIERAPLSKRYIWRIDLCKTEQFWSGWFQGLSLKFLSSQVPKLLILAGIDRLDKELMLGQMQGKFQMQVLPHCGHAVHEDVPEKVAEALASFLVRHKFAEPLDGYAGAIHGSC